jgi:hypothetical protein
LNNDGSVGGPDDALGFGFFPGQYGMAVYSKYPLVAHETRTFQTFRWKDMPGALLPDDLATPEPDDWYTPEELEIFRLSSKSHWDIAVRLGGEIIHILVSHPTPPVFDGPEDRNGLRNHDEIRFWADYVDPAKSDYIYDDTGHWGGLAARAHFVIMGDQNADPFDGDSTADAVMQLLGHPLINVSVPALTRVVPTMHTLATRQRTRPISPTATRATCVPTTCCRRVRYASAARGSSGPRRTIRFIPSWGISPFQARTIVSFGSMSACRGITAATAGTTTGNPRNGSWTASGVRPAGWLAGTTRRNSRTIPTSCNAAGRPAGRAPGVVAVFTQRVSFAHCQRPRDARRLCLARNGQLPFLR